MTMRPTPCPLVKPAEPTGAAGRAGGSRLVVGLRRGRARPRPGLLGCAPHGAAAVDPEMAVNIEHEDQELDQIEGLRLAAGNLKAAAANAGL